ncbi:CoA transferase subunit A [Nocardia exalbida]|uniref:CoA transferase subunit A n=1 Tax=Nocardia exalbida TaxID=290231 RepID=UPI0002EAABA7|nr:CoA transferase subunit A [Nocardia exalbida]
MDKTVSDPSAAVVDIPSGATLAVGGFGLCGIPEILIEALEASGVIDLDVVSNNCGVDDWGLGRLLTAGQIRRVTASYVGENKEFARRYLSGELEVELTPQGSLAERLRAGGCGIPAFYTPAGLGTPVADGTMSLRYAPDGSTVVHAPAKEVRTFDGRDYILESAIRTDFALVHAALGDRHGNLVFNAAAGNFNALCAMAGKITIAEVERLVEPGEILPGRVHVPGVFVQRVVPVADVDKRIEKRTVQLPLPA